MLKEERLSETIDFLRFPLIIGIAFIHFDIVSLGFTANGINYVADKPDWFYYVIRLFSNVLSSVCVPLFYIFSGFLFFYKTDFTADIYKRKLRSRAKTLLLPFVIWNILAVLLTLTYKLPFLESAFPDAAKMDIQITFERILNIFFNKDKSIFTRQMPVRSTPYPLDGPLWYIRDLMVMVLLTPVIYSLIKKIGARFVILLGCLWGVLMPIVFPHGNYITMLSKAAFFFSWGAYYSIAGKDFVEELTKIKIAPIIFLPAAIADTLTKGCYINTFIREATILCGIVTTIIIAANLLENKKVKVNPRLVGSVFFIYALHDLILQSIGKTILKTLHLPDNVFSTLAFYFAIPILTVLLCLTIYLVLKRFAPAVCNILTGSRERRA